MLRVYGLQDEKMVDAQKCKLELKKLVKGKIQKPTKKKVKIRELMDNIRDGRKKFKELMNIYNGRIEKLENKISNFKIKKQKKVDE